MFRLLYSIVLPVFLFMALLPSAYATTEPPPEEPDVPTAQTEDMQEVDPPAVAVDADWPIVYSSEEQYTDQNGYLHTVKTIIRHDPSWAGGSIAPSSSIHPQFCESDEYTASFPSPLYPVTAAAAATCSQNSNNSTLTRSDTTYYNSQQITQYLKVTFDEWLFDTGTHFLGYNIEEVRIWWTRSHTSLTIENDGRSRVVFNGANCSGNDVYNSLTSYTTGSSQGTPNWLSSSRSYDYFTTTPSGWERRSNGQVWLEMTFKGYGSVYWSGDTGADTETRIELPKTP